MISERKIQVGKYSVYRLLQNFHNGIIPADNALCINRRPFFLNNTSVNSVASVLTENNGRTYKPGDISSLSQAQRYDEVRHMGYEPINAVSPYRTTITNYIALVAYESRISIDNNSAVSKTNTRLAAKNSLIAAVNYGVSVTFNHYIPIGKTSIKSGRELAQAPIGIKLLYHGVKTCWCLTFFLCATTSRIVF